jgi:hypothetical protein
MQFFSFLRPKRREIPAVIPPATVRPSKSAVLVLIDSKSASLDRETSKPIGIRWNVLRRLLTDTIGKTDVLLRYVYRQFYPQDKTFENEFRQKWAEHGYELLGHKKDVDAWVASDLWFLALKAAEDPDVKKLRILLVASDGDFARGLGHIRTWFSKTHEIEIVVFAWTDKLSRDLANEADTIIRLEEVPNLSRQKKSNDYIAAIL